MSDLLKNTTPGPWSVPHFAEPGANCQCGYVLCDSLMGAVATVHCSGEGDDWQKHGDSPRFAEACANARLIAAAPELAAENARLRKALEGARDVIATMADCLSPLVTEALVGDPLAEIDSALAHKETV